MRKIFFIVILLCSCLNAKASDCGFFIYGGGGVSSTFNIQNSDTIPIEGVSTPYDATLIASNITGSANAGLGYNFSPCFGVQGNFTYWGDQDYGVSYQFPTGAVILNSRSRSYSYGAEVLGYLPLCCRTLTPFVKLGVAHYHSNWHFGSNTGVPVTENTDFNNHGCGFVFGAGLIFAYNRCIDISFQAQGLYTDKQNILDSHVTLCQYSINLIYHFGSR